MIDPGLKLAVAVWIVLSAGCVPGMLWLFYTKKIIKEDIYEYPWAEYSVVIFIVIQLLAILGGAVFLMYNQL